MTRFASFPISAILVGVTLVAVSPASAHAQSPVETEPQAPTGWVGLLVQQDAKNDAEMQSPIVISVEQGSPAQKAGLAAGDTILSYDNVDPRTNPVGMLRLLVPKRKIVVQYRRNGLRKTTVVVGKRASNTPQMSFEVTLMSVDSVMSPKSGVVLSPVAPVAIMAPLAARGDAPLAGANVTRMNAGLATALGVPNAGLLVIDVLADTPAERAGMKSGDIIVSVAGTPAKTPSSIIRAMYAKTAKGVRTLTLDILRKGKPQKLHLNW